MDLPNINTWGGAPRKWIAARAMLEATDTAPDEVRDALDEHATTYAALTPPERPSAPTLDDVHDDDFHDRLEAHLATELVDQRLAGALDKLRRAADTRLFRSIDLADLRPALETAWEDAHALLTDARDGVDTETADDAEQLPKAERDKRSAQRRALRVIERIETAQLHYLEATSPDEYARTMVTADERFWCLYTVTNYDEPTAGLIFRHVNRQTLRSHHAILFTRAGIKPKLAASPAEAEQRRTFASKRRG